MGTTTTSTTTTATRDASERESTAATIVEVVAAALVGGSTFAVGEMFATTAATRGIAFAIFISHFREHPQRKVKSLEKKTP